MRRVPARRAAAPYGPWHPGPPARECAPARARRCMPHRSRTSDASVPPLRSARDAPRPRARGPSGSQRPLLNSFRGRQAASRGESIRLARAGSVGSTPRQALLDLLKPPLVPIRVAERGKGLVGATLGVGTRNRAAVEVEHLTDLDASGDQIFAYRIDVVDGQLRAPKRAWLGRGDTRAE